MNNFISLSNKKYKRKGITRHHYSFCSYCKSKRKNIILHYKRYHPEVINDIEKSLSKGYIGNINGIRFYRT